MQNKDDDNDDDDDEDDDDDDKSRRSQWSHGLRHVLSSTARTLGSWVRIPLEAWMCVRVFLCCVVLCR
jgi:hypothetical protein